jgi:hypothetical protein
MQDNWSQQRDVGEVNRRAGGRRRYNAARKRIAERRLIPLGRRIAQWGDLESALGIGQPKPLPRHLIPALARALGVHRTTVWRDVQRLRDRKNYCWQYSGDTGLVTVTLYGLGKFVYRF